MAYQCGSRICKHLDHGGEDSKMDNELYHSGILGMKWGVRRTTAQLGHPTTKNKTTTERVKSIKARSKAKAKKIAREGREQAKIDKAKAKADAVIKKAQDKVKRRNEYGEDIDAKATTSTKNEPITTPSSRKPKSVSEMSNEELAEGVQRLNLEKMYTQAYNDLNPAPKQVEKGQSFAKKFLNDAVKSAAINAGKDILTKYATKQASKLLGLDDNMETLKKEADKLVLKSKMASAKKNINEVGKYFGQEEKNKQNQSNSGSNSTGADNNSTSPPGGRRPEDIPSYDNDRRDGFVNTTVDEVRNDPTTSAGESYVRTGAGFVNTTVENVRNEPVTSAGEDHVRRYLALGPGS